MATEIVNQDACYFWAGRQLSLFKIYNHSNLMYGQVESIIVYRYCIRVKSFEWGSYKFIII